MRDSRLRLGLLLALITVAAAAARVANHRSVFPPTGEVELAPTDSHFYVRYAALQRHNFPRFTSFDPYLNHPHGAQLYLPLPHALIVAAFLGAGDRPEAGAAWVDPVAGMIEWACVVLLALLAVGRRAALAIGALLALIPAIVEVQVLGNADHHVHEPMLAAASALALIPALRERSGRWPWIAGVILGAGRLVTPTAFLVIPPAALAVVLVGWSTRQDPAWAHLGAAARKIAAAAAATLLLGAAVFGLPFSLEYEQFSAFHPLLAGAVLLGASGLTGVLRGERGALRWLIVGIALGTPLVAQLLRAAGHLGKQDPLLAIVIESFPLWSDPRWAFSLLGPVLLWILPAVVVLALRLRHGGELNAAVGLAFAVPFGFAAALQARFVPSFAAAAAIACVFGATALVSAAGRWQRTARVAVALAFLPLAGAVIPRPYEPPPRDLLLSRPTLRWMRENLPPASPDPYSPASRPTYGVVAIHLLGHVVPLWSERPTVATMASGDPAFIASNLRAGEVLAAEDDETAFQAARATDARYLLITPSDRILGHGRPTPKSQLLHLLDHAGMESEARPASSRFRLIHDSDEQRLRPQGGSAARVFEVVEGALLEVEAPPEDEVTARTRLTTNRGETLEYVRRSNANPGGRTLLRVSYPGDYEVRTADRTLRLQVTEADVREGRVVPLAR